MSTSNGRSRSKATGIILIITAVALGLGSAGAGNGPSMFSSPFNNSISSDTSADEIFRDLWERQEEPNLRITAVVPFDELDDYNDNSNHITFGRLKIGMTVYTYEGGVLPDFSKLAEHDVVIVETEEQFRQLEEAGLVVDSVNQGLTPVVLATKEETAEGLVRLDITTKVGEHYDIDLVKLNHAIERGLDLEELYRGSANDSASGPLTIKALSAELSDATRVMAAALAEAAHGPDALSDSTNVDQSVESVSQTLTFPSYSSEYEHFYELSGESFADSTPHGLYVTTEGEIIQRRYSLDDGADVVLMYPTSHPAISRYVVALSEDGQEYITREGVRPFVYGA